MQLEFASANTKYNPKLKTCLASREVEHAKVAAIINAALSGKAIKARQAYNPLL
jgi:ABC-type branched-subunit amino acid transport system substrate-binding protein